MRTLVLLAVFGLVAQLVDGTLGMGYGLTSSSLLLLAGLSPATASASVHLAEIGTTLAGGASHWGLGNTDMRLVARLGLPGALGAFLGASILSRLPVRAATPVTATLLAVLGVYVLARFTLRPARQGGTRTCPHRTRFLAPLGVVGGFLDATGGGGWGPVVTTALMSSGRTAPRTVVGSVSASEFLVTVAASLGFLAGLGGTGIRPGVVAALLAGGLVAAPVAAWLVARLPTGVLGAAVGGLIVATNLRTLLAWAEASAQAYAITYTLLVPTWLVLLCLAVSRSHTGQAGRAATSLSRPQRQKVGV
ncbi:sulfite exporter TauE/SafE family protein [Actinomyces sp. 2119]|uniref:sulfite exporter TauE/SafE family protein n=1 Tax=Actinomyces sp. 2119 TaxID=2321393 RepID=UPI000E6B76B3|nr:sulfite exporter TauE/SafE family protein [Actinomyces sp. 2119]RJF43131.1 sulfite exporter TauE/SafE family protein [Actinomyces sp. 2119]